jgi:hypothetical protein
MRGVLLSVMARGGRRGEEEVEMGCREELCDMCRPDARSLSMAGLGDVRTAH